MRKPFRKRWQWPWSATSAYSSWARTSACPAGASQAPRALGRRFGESRVSGPPISELGGAGVAVGAALLGGRPVFEFQFSDFATLAMEQIVNQAAKLRFMLGGKVSVPLVMRLPGGS